MTEHDKVMPHGINCIQDIIEGNRLIAEFMGFYGNPTTKKPITSIEKDSKYHSSWDWLMPVVEKIERFFKIDGKEVEFRLICYEDEISIIAKYTDKEWERIIEVNADGSGKLLNTYKAVIEFIKWQKP
jgi:hypothetical protein